LRDLLVLLTNHCQIFSLGTVLCAPMDVWLTEKNVFQPDLLFVATDRSRIISEDGVHGAPDLVVEILSPSSVRRDLGDKRTIYAREGVREYWVVEQPQRRVRVFSFARPSPPESELVVSTEQTFGSPLFPGLCVQVSSIFRNL